MVALQQFQVGPILLSIVAVVRVELALYVANLDRVSWLILCY